MTEYTAEMAHQAAARGAQWMDKHCPDWVNELNLERLDLSNSEVCVLGQTARCLMPHTPWGFSPAYLQVVDVYWPRARHGMATRLGFNVPSECRNTGQLSAYEMLTIAWQELIRERLEAANV